MCPKAAHNSTWEQHVFSQVIGQSKSNGSARCQNHWETCNNYKEDSNGLKYRIFFQVKRR